MWAVEHHDGARLRGLTWPAEDRCGGGWFGRLMWLPSIVTTALYRGRLTSRDSATAGW
jgi:hypothetical protein